MFLRVRNQNDVVVNLPSAVARDLELTLDVTYAGPIRTQPIEQESVERRAGGRPRRSATNCRSSPPSRNWLFSNRSHWYPQSQVTDYATATIRFTPAVATYKAVASRHRARQASPIAGRSRRDQHRRSRTVSPTSTRRRAPGPLHRRRSISKFTRASIAVARCALTTLPRRRATRCMLAIEANRRQQERGRDIVPTAAEILRSTHRSSATVPYDALTIAMVEHDRPGGHSPAYFAVLNNPLPVTPWTSRHDPAAFNNFPEFYIAHEIAHQWWGQAVGWKNYHEQWLSEGFAQYFAALYAKERRGETAFRDVLRQFRRWAMDQSDQGAVYLGYRLGHIKGDSRVFRAIVYNKGAAVLHMLRRLVGDEAFFRGMRRYYSENRSRRPAPKTCSGRWKPKPGRSLERFFERWIYESGMPRVRYTTAVEGQEARRALRADRRASYDVPGHGDDALRRQDRRRSRRRSPSRRREAIPAGGNAAKRRGQRRQRGARDVRRRKQRTRLATRPTRQGDRFPPPAAARPVRAARTPRRTSLPSTM